MSEEIDLLHWTTNSGHKKGELVLQTNSIMVYKTSKRFLRFASNFREIIYAEIPINIIEKITIQRSGVFKNHLLKIKVNEKGFHKLLDETHSGLYKHLVKLFNKNHNLFFPIFQNKFKDIKNFTNLIKEKMNS